MRPPDSDTLIVNSMGPIAVDPTLYHKLPYNPLADVPEARRSDAACGQALREHLLAATEEQGHATTGAP